MNHRPRLSSPPLSSTSWIGWHQTKPHKNTFTPTQTLRFKMKQYQTSNEPMATMHIHATNTKKNYALPPTSGIMSQIRSTTGSRSIKSLMREPSNPPLSSGLDFLMEMHVRRENSNSKAQKMTRKERTIILENALKILEEE